MTLARRASYDVWRRNNLWLLNEALVHGPQNATLIALWNGARGDGPGGTEDMIRIATARCARVEIIDSNRTFGLEPEAAPEKS